MDLKINLNINLKSIFILMVVIGIIAAAQAGTSVLRDTTSDIGGLNLTSINISNNVGSTGLTQVKTGSFNRDTSTASGTQAITGVGFRPKSVIFIGGINSAAPVSWGVDDGATPVGMGDWGGVSAGTYNTAQPYSIALLFSSGNYYQGKIQSFDADGFTINWLKTGSPTGTATITYIAQR